MNNHNALDVRCPYCRAETGQPCLNRIAVHVIREKRARIQPLVDQAGRVACPTCCARPGMDCRRSFRPHQSRVKRGSVFAEALDWLSSLDRINGIPVVPAHAIKASRSSFDDFAVAFRCPFCGTKHHHGADEEDYDRPPSHRVAHCLNSESPFARTGYFLALRREEPA